MDDRWAMDAISYVRQTGCQWKARPRCLGSLSTVHDQFQEWREAGVFKRMWQVGLLENDERIGLDCERHAMDGAMIKVPFGEKGTGPNHTDRGGASRARSGVC